MSNSTNVLGGEASNYSPEIPSQQKEIQQAQDSWKSNPFDISVDDREQLFNERKIGKKEQLATAKELITSLHGIMLDVDVPYISPSTLIPVVPPCPQDFYGKHLKKWLTNNPVLAKAEVRDSGSGIHVIFNLDEPIEFKSEAARDRWDCKIRLIQSCLPIDPGQPSITAFTRPLGSTNSKNGRKVQQLAPGVPVSQEELEYLAKLMRDKPFATVFGIVTGTNRITPCPFCEGQGTQFSALDWVGKCYGSCGDISLVMLYEKLLKPRSDKGSKVHHE